MQVAFCEQYFVSVVTFWTHFCLLSLCKLHSTVPFLCNHAFACRIDIDIESKLHSVCSILFWWSHFGLTFVSFLCVCAHSTLPTLSLSSGICNTQTQKCDCDKPWSGDSCDTLNFLPVTFPQVRTRVRITLHAAPFLSCCSLEPGLPNETCWPLFLHHSTCSPISQLLFFGTRTPKRNVLAVCAPSHHMHHST